MMGAWHNIMIILEEVYWAIVSITVMQINSMHNNWFAKMQYGNSKFLKFYNLFFLLAFLTAFNDKGGL